MELLILLVSRPGQLVARAEIAEHLWSSEVFVDTEHGINTAIRKLRHLLRDDPENPQFIQTVTGMGYRFIAPIATVEPERTEAPADVPIPSRTTSIQGGLKAESVDRDFLNQPSPTTAAKSEVHRSARHWRRIVLIAASIVLSVLLLDWLYPPEPPLPKITRTVQLTSDGLEKFPETITDGVRVYFAELRNRHWTLCAIPISGGEATAIPLPFPDAEVLNILPDKSELLIGEGPPIHENQLWRVPILGGSPRRMGGIVAHAGGWSPDGRVFMFMHEGDVYLANGDGSAPRKVDLPQAAPNTWALSPRWSPDGSRITFTRYILDKHLSSIWEVSAQGEHPHLLLPNWQDPPMHCCGEWSPDGSLFFFDRWKDLEGGAPLAPAPDIWVIREQSTFLHKTSTVPTQFTAGPVHFLSHVLGADGKSLFAMGTQRREELSQFDSKTKRFSAYPGLGPAHSISFSRDDWVAYTKFPQGELWIKKADGSKSLQLTFRPLMAYGPESSLTGNRLCFMVRNPDRAWRFTLCPPKAVKLGKSTKERRVAVGDRTGQLTAARSCSAQVSIQRHGKLMCSICGRSNCRKCPDQMEWIGPGGLPTANTSLLSRMTIG